MASFVETPPFDSSIHLLSLPPTAEQQQAIDELRQLLSTSNNDYNSNGTISAATQEWCRNEHILKLFLIARTFNVTAAYEMILFALNWRDIRQPHAIELQDDWHVKMSVESETGKIRRPGHLFSSNLHSSLLSFDLI
jgi:hypothetical protein